MNYAVVLFIPQFAQAGIKDFQNKVYAENQLDHVMTIQIDQNIKTKNSQDVLDNIKDVMNEYHSSIFLLRKIITIIISIFIQMIMIILMFWE